MRLEGASRVVNFKGKTIKLVGVRAAYQRHFEKAIDLLTKGFEAEKIITHIVSLESLPEVFSQISVENVLKGKTTGKILIDMRLKGKVILTIEE